MLYRNVLYKLSQQSDTLKSPTLVLSRNYQQQNLFTRGLIFFYFSYKKYYTIYLNIYLNIYFLFILINNLNPNKKL